MAIQEPDYVWMDGKYINWKDANVPILTHAMHYGTAVFERASRTSSRIL